MNKIILIASIIVTSLALGSCKSVKYTEAKDTDKQMYIYDTIKHTEYITRLKYDSVYIHDSIYVYSSNDTIYITKYKDRFKYMYKYDTVYIQDTIFKAREVTITNSKNIVKEKQNKGTLYIFIFVILFIVSICVYLKIKK